MPGLWCLAGTELFLKKIRFVEILVFFACLSVLALPVLNNTVAAPAFTEFLKSVAEKNLIKAAAKMATLIELQEDLADTTLFSQEFLHQIEEDRELLDLVKVKIFTPGGMTIYSSAREDVGKRTNKDFFPALVGNQEARSHLKTVDKGNPDEEDFILETYVPIIKSGRTIGVFEIYSDMTESRLNLSKVVNTVNWIVFSASLFLLFAVLSSAYLSRRSGIMRERAEIEKDLLIADLSAALGEIKALRGILPLCSFCKKIRDDSGYWEQVDVYINQHSDADVSHGVCPDCAAEHYPGAYEDILARENKLLSDD
jgi:hypothetical protein